MVRFSVLVPVYNRAPYVRAAIDSILAQSYRNFEIIAVDDGSTDESAAILRSYGNRITFLEQPNSGPEVARNTAAAAAQGEYFALFDSDDIMMPNALEIYDRIIREFDAPPLIIGAEKFYEDGDPLPDFPDESEKIELTKAGDYLSKDIPLAVICSLHVIRRSTWERAGGFRHTDNQTWYGDGFDFLLKIGTEGPCIIIRKPYTVLYRLHSANSIRSLRQHSLGMRGLAEAEWAGAYPGGVRRLLDRYAFIGGISASWAYYYLLPAREYKSALRLMWGTAPMVFSALLRRALRPFRRSEISFELPGSPSNTMISSSTSKVANSTPINSQRSSANVSP